MINSYRFLICVSLRKSRFSATAKIPLSVCHRNNNERGKIRIYFFSGRFENCAFLVASKSQPYENLI